MEEKKEIITTEEELESLIAVAASRSSKKFGDIHFGLLIMGVAREISVDVLNHLSGREKLPQESIDLYREIRNTPRETQKIMLDIVFRKGN
ncbi:hypothetical protein [Massilistercora timonensis]|uniref:hypothetical protein n=1 Tax=Massilistercora timonensis TaxID=2086584 RepID=UPI003AB41115